LPLPTESPGIKNIWLKTERNQLRDFGGVYVIEFINLEAAADYEESAFSLCE